MVICPIAIAVHCTGCPLVKFCPAKTTLGDYGKEHSEKLSCSKAKGKDNTEGSIPDDWTKKTE